MVEGREIHHVLRNKVLSIRGILSHYCKFCREDTRQKILAHLREIMALADKIEEDGNINR